MTHYRTDNTAQLICYAVQTVDLTPAKQFNHQVGGDTLSPYKVKLIKQKLAEKHDVEPDQIIITNVIPMGWNGEG